MCQEALRLSATRGLEGEGTAEIQAGQKGERRRKAFIEVLRRLLKSKLGTVEQIASWYLLLDII